MSACTLVSGTAGLFDPLRQLARCEVAFNPQRPGHDKRVFRGRFVKQTLIPKRPHAVLLKGPTVKAYIVARCWRQLLHVAYYELVYGWFAAFRDFAFRQWKFPADFPGGRRIKVENNSDFNSRV